MYIAAYFLTMTVVKVYYTVYIWSLLSFEQVLHLLGV